MTRTAGVYGIYIMNCKLISQSYNFSRNKGRLIFKHLHQNLIRGLEKVLFLLSKLCLQNCNYREPKTLIID